MPELVRRERRLRRQLIMAVSLPVLVMLLLAGVLGWQVNRLLRESRWVAHSDRVVGQAHYTQKLLVDMETGLRGFLLTNNPSFLEPYESAKQMIEPGFLNLSSLVADNSSQTRNVETAHRIFLDWRRYSENVLELKRAGKEYLRPVLEGEGKRRMDQMRLILDLLISAEESLRQAREATTREVAQTTVRVGFFLIAVFGLSLGFVAAHQLRSAQTLFRNLLYSERAANQSRDEFFLIASHELKTPITSLDLQLQGALRRLKKNERTPPEAQEYKKLLESFKRQADRLTHLVEQMIDLARIRAGRLELESQPTDLSRVVEDVLARMSDQIAEAGSPVELKLEPGLVGPWDPFRIEQILINLLSNALRHGRERPISVNLSRRDHAAQLKITDQGPGIPQSQQSEIFERFTRLSSIRHHRGLGLGLYIARFIAEAHGGSLHVESPPGAGATFTLELPIADGKEQRKTA